MYNIILVDDEYAVVEILQEVIDYEKYGFNLIGIYDNGREALEVIKNIHIDVVVSDIQMPNYSGLDFVRDIRTITDDVEIVFLSAYSNFEYATFGIDNDVFKYVLKPITIKSFTEVLVSLKEQLDKKNIKQRKYIENIFCNNVSIELQNAFHDIIYKKGNTDMDKLDVILKREGFEYDLTSDYSTIIDIDLIENDLKFSKHEEGGMNTILHIVKNLMCRKEILASPLIYTMKSIKVLLLCHTDDSDYFGDVLNEFKEQLSKDLADICDFRVSIIQGRIFPNINKLADYVEIYNIAHHDAETLISLMLDGQTSAQFLIDLCDKRMEQYGNQSMYMEVYAYSIYQMISSYVEQEDLIEFGIYKDIEIPAKLNVLGVPISINAMIRQLTQTVEKLVMYFSAKSENKRGAVEEALSYIKEHYMEDITLNSVAKHVYRNPVYLSRRIREYTQMSFPDYLNQVRIAKAKELLTATNDSVTVIAQNVGYSSMGYFHKKFKEITGMTANGFRKQSAIFP